MSSPSLRARTVRTRMVSRVSDMSSGLSWPLRTTLSLICVLTGPRILSTASCSVIPFTGLSSISTMRSLARMPALAAGVSSIGETTLISPSSIVTSMPSPPN